MDDLLIKYLLKEVTPAEAAQVEQWILADTGNRKRYEQLKATWEISGQNTLPVVPDAQQALQRLKRKLEAAGTGVTGKQTGPVTSARGGFYSLLRPWRAAAIFAAVVCLGAVMYFILTPTKAIDAPVSDVPKPTKQVDSNLAKPAAASMQTDIAGDNSRRDTLPDGSIVTLHKHAAISYYPGLKGDTRTVVLKGDAFFSVAHNPSRPFIVRVNEITVKVVGTSFNISSTTAHTEVVVKTGIVQVIAGVDSPTLYTGDKIVVSKTGKEITINRKNSNEQGRNEQDSSGVDSKQKKHGNKVESAKIEAQKQTARDIIEDMTRLKIIVDKDHLSWFALDNRQFLVDGKVVRDSLHQIFKSRYIKNGMGYYYGPRKGLPGGGLCFDKSDLY